MGDQVLWNKAMEKLKTDRSEFSLEEICNVGKFIRLKYDLGGLDSGVVGQVKRDVVFYKKYDAIAMWVGDGGLIEHEPEFVTELVKMFGIKE